MTSISPVVVPFTGQSDPFFAELRKVNKGLSGLQADVDKVSAASSKLAGNIARGLAGYVSFASVRAIIRETALAQQGQAQLQAAITSTGEAAGWSFDRLIAMSKEMARESTFGQSEIIEAQTRLLTYSSIVGDKVPQAMRIVLDQSARLGVGLAQSAETIGRALETPSRGVASLAEQGFNFTQSQKAVLKALEDAGRVAEAQQIVLDVLAESYGGAAHAARNTFGGAMASVQNAVRELMQGDGNLNQATDGVNALADVLRSPEVQEGFALLVSSLTTVVGLLAKGAAGAAGFAKWIGESAAAMVHGPAADDLVRTSDAIIRLQNQMKKLRDGGGINPITGDALPEFAVQRLLASYERDLEKLQQQYAAGLEAAAEQARRQAAEASPSSAVAGTPIGTVETEDQRKERERREKAERDYRLQMTQEYYAALNSMETEALAAGDAAAKTSFEWNMGLIDAEMEAHRRAAEERVRLQQDVEADLASMRERNIDHAIGLLAMLGQHSKAFAVASVVLERATAIRRIYQANLVAAELAFSSQLVPGDPTSLPRAAAAKAAVLAQGRIAMALTAAEGALQLSMGAGGAGGAVSPGTPSNPIYTEDAAGRQRGADSQNVVQVLFNGPVYGMENFEDQLIKIISDAVNGRDVVIIGPNSRQAMELQA